MPNILVAIFDNITGRMILGVLNLSSGHPVVTCFLLAALAGAVALAWADLLGGRGEASLDGERPHGSR